MSDLNAPGHEDGIQGDDPSPGEEEHDLAEGEGAETARPLGRTPLPPD